MSSNQILKKTKMKKILIQLIAAIILIYLFYLLMNKIAYAF